MSKVSSGGGGGHTSSVKHTQAPKQSKKTEAPKETHQPKEAKKTEETKQDDKVQDKLRSVTMQKLKMQPVHRLAVRLQPKPVEIRN